MNADVHGAILRNTSGSTSNSLTETVQSNTPHELVVCCGIYKCKCQACHKCAIL